MYKTPNPLRLSIESTTGIASTAGPRCRSRKRRCRGARRTLRAQTTENRRSCVVTRAPGLPSRRGGVIVDRGCGCCPIGRLHLVAGTKQMVTKVLGAMKIPLYRWYFPPKYLRLMAKRRLDRWWHQWQQRQAAQTHSRFPLCRYPWVHPTRAPL